MLLTVGHVHAQHPFLSTFTASAVTDGVFLEWTLKEGSTCLGIIIERADEHGQFHEIGQIDEVCGSIIEPVDYDFLDEDPLTGSINDYRLILGLDGTTDVVSVEYFNVDVSGFSVTMHEASGTLNIFSLEPLTVKNGLLIYDVNGKEIERFSFGSGASSVDVSGLNAGLFFIAITEDDEIIHVARIVKSI